MSWILILGELLLNHDWSSSSSLSQLIKRIKCRYCFTNFIFSKNLVLKYLHLYIDTLGSAKSSLSSCPNLLWMHILLIHFIEQDTQRNRIGQWLNTTSGGKILQLSYSLNSEAREGHYTVQVWLKGAMTYHYFKVEKYGKLQIIHFPYFITDKRTLTIILSFFSSAQIWC